MPAGAAFQADIRAQAEDGPFVAAARMRLAQPNNIVQLQVGEHGEIIP